jgi:hypothetical protein
MNVDRSAACAPAAAVAAVEAFVGACPHHRIRRGPSERRHCGRSNRRPALPRSGASSSMMTMVLAGVRRDCPRAGEEGEGGNGVGGASMVRVVDGT